MDNDPVLRRIKDRWGDDPAVMRCIGYGPGQIKPEEAQEHLEDLKGLLGYVVGGGMQDAESRGQEAG